MHTTLPPAEACDRARAAKDARFDGLFFTAVRSTGIYCRPVCPAPTPKRHNITYYPTAAAAAAAGYRPCLRCRPELSPEALARGGEDVVQRALALVADGALQDASVDALAQRVGVGGRQLRRIFLAHTGATPLAVHTTRRLLLAKQLLTETALPVTQVALAAGFNSLRRFNAAFQEGCGMAPSAIRRQHGETPGNALTLRLGYRPPLDFAAMLAFLAKRAIPGIERVGEDRYERVLGPIDAPAWICVTAHASRPELSLQISDVDPRAIPDIVRRVRRIFDLDADLQEVHAAFKGEPLLAKAVRRRPGLRVPGGWDGFEVAVRAVLGQQVSVAGATTLARRLVDAHGEPVSVAHQTAEQTGLTRVFPTPQRLVDAPLESIGLPRSRAATLRSLARGVIDGRIDFDAGQRLDDFIARFTALPGIGPWTAQYVAMRALGHPDAFPAGDLVLQQVLGGATSGDGQRLSERATDARAQPWRPWRAYAVLQLWHLAGDDAAAKNERRKQADVVR
ncbi:DNA-3-methyladenine glycosylase II [Luteimonas cucumeris]|uniref:DNA-3-methyladenine glycosylase II n=1 Tax=Luteimonas cucumeris TaxID=985012 RepID=A0A562KZW6_9GAMM|nr:DNA-3-methyladenine glycosylase 2 [Luteimonas cucumeris]TWI00970.1 DNA-3-methyladenine glycosylase II [Luteimonas cucumeris]